MAFLLDFEDNVREIEQYFQFLLIVDNLGKIENIKSLSKLKFPIEGKNRFLLRDVIDNTGSYAIDHDLRKILKSTSFLLLYNLIEGSINAALNDYFNSFSVKKEKFEKFKPEIQAVWLNYKYKFFKTQQTPTKQITQIVNDLFEDIVEILPKEIKKDGALLKLTDYNAYLAEIGKNEIAGNIDARKIRDLSNMYGFKLPRRDTCDSLATIKSKRNSLAHGEATFSDMGREPIEEIIKMKNETIRFLRSVLKAIDISISKSRYMA